MMQFKLAPKSRKVYFALIFLVVILTISLFAHKIALSHQSEIESTNLATGTISEKKTTPTKSEIICLDPGHGGKDVGAEYKVITEANINLLVSNQLKSLLESAGYRVFMSRSDDSFVYKRDRARYCNSVKATIMVSIHHNTYTTDTSVDYSTALYYKNSDQALASNILESVTNDLGTKNQGIAKFDNSMLYIATMPAMMSEAFFLTNSKEYSLTNKKDSDRLKSEAKAIFTGIENYFANPNKSASPVDPNSLIIDRTDLGD